MNAIGVTFLAAGVVAGAVARYNPGGIADSPHYAPSHHPRHISILAVPWNLDARYSSFAAVRFC